MAAGVSTSSNITELIPEITLAVDYIYQDMALAERLVRVQNASGVPGLTVEFPIFTEVVGSASPAETGAPTSHQMDLTMPALTVARRAVNVHLSYLAQGSASGDTVNQIARAMAMAKVKDVDGRVFGVLSGTTNWATSAGATNASLTITHLMDGLNLLEINEVTGQLNGVVHPFQYKTIRSGLTPVANDDGVAVDAASLMVREGFVSRMFGVNWYVSNRIATGTVDATAGVYGGLIFDPDAIGYAFKSIGPQEFQIQNEAELALNILIMNYADSAGVLRGAGIAKLHST